MPHEDPSRPDPLATVTRPDVVGHGTPPAAPAGRRPLGRVFDGTERMDHVGLDHAGLDPAGLDLARLDLADPVAVDLDDDLLALDPPAVGPGRRVRGVLAVALLATLGFTAGAWMQKRDDAQTVSAAAALQTRAGTFAGRAGPGGQRPEGAGGAGGAGSLSVASGAGSAAPSATVPLGTGGLPVVVGSLTSTTVLTAAGFAGPRPGQAVIVYGTRPATGAVRATAVVARTAG